ncbi:MAG TPA: endonuclease domain-containing protein [Sphingomonas sp.]|nr:endonuclease domain-containing protein [Sphingomonas sp.]
MSLPEVLLWQQLRKRPGGFKFRRQTPQAGYKLDFTCLEARLAIEVDGEAHNRGDRPQRDAARDRRLSRCGFVTLRIPASAILDDLDSVLTAVVHACRERGPLHHRPAAGGPPPRSGEEL